MNKKIVMMTAMALAATVAFAAPKTSKKPVATDDDAPTTGKEAKIMLDQFPKLGRQSTLSAPALQGGSIIGKCYNKPRSWIVLEAKYTTFVKWQDQLTFTWHVLLETKTATENKGNKEGLAPYSYFTTSTTYQNIPQGSHAASVCLHPSYLERFGEVRPSVSSSPTRRARSCRATARARSTESPSTRSGGHTQSGGIMRRPFTWQQRIPRNTAGAPGTGWHQHN